jgi:hypothetical protein
MRLGGVVFERFGEIFAVGDERAEDPEDLTDARGHGPGGLGLEGGDRGRGVVGHRGNKSTTAHGGQGKMSILGNFS